MFQDIVSGEAGRFMAFTLCAGVSILGLFKRRSKVERKGFDVEEIVGKRLDSRVELKDFPETRNKNLLLAAKGVMTAQCPVWMMRQAGRYLPEFRELRKKYDFFSLCQNPELAAEVTIQPLERFKDLDAVIVFSDILVIPQAMGMDVRMVPGRGPVFPEPLIFPEDLDSLVFLDSLSSDKALNSTAVEKFIEAKLGYVFDVINLTRQKVDGKVPVIGFSGAPFTLMGYMIEGGGSKTYEKTKTWLWNHKEASHRLLKALTDYVVEYCVLQVKNGAQLLQIFESNAGELSLEQFNEFCFEYLQSIAKRINARLKEDNIPQVPLTVFARGANQEGVLERFDKDTEYDTISLDWKIDQATARGRVKSKALQGNLDPCTLFASKSDIRVAVEKMLVAFDAGRNGAYIANLGHGMMPSHNPEHAGEFINAVHEVSARLRKK